MQFPVTRMRRLRKNSKIRDIVRETKLQKEDLIYPIYFKQDLEGDEKEEISSLPGEFRYSLKSGVEFAKKLESKGLKSIIVFGIPPEDEKDEIATPDYASFSRPQWSDLDHIVELRVLLDLHGQLGKP